MMGYNYITIIREMHVTAVGIFSHHWSSHYWKMFDINLQGALYIMYVSSAPYKWAARANILIQAYGNTIF